MFLWRSPLLGQNMDSETTLYDTLVFDRDCELCCWARDIISRWDRSRRIRYLAFQDPLFRHWFPDAADDEVPKAMLFIDHRGRVWEGFKAFRQMVRWLPGGRLIAALLYVPGVPWAGKRFYEWLARNRYRFQKS